jgi:hypothetical protein
MSDSVLYDPAANRRIRERELREERRSLRWRADREDYERTKSKLTITILNEFLVWAQAAILKKTGMTNPPWRLEQSRFPADTYYAFLATVDLWERLFRSRGYRRFPKWRALVAKGTRSHNHIRRYDPNPQADWKKHLIGVGDRMIALLEEEAVHLEARQAKRKKKVA